MLLFYENYGYKLADLTFVNDFNIFIIEQNINGSIKYRLVEAPKDKLKLVHDRIFKFLNKIILPQYLI